MSAIFISHSSRDNEVAQRIKDWLSDLGFENVFLDFDDTGGIMPGERWERRLYDEISRCQAVVLVHTPAWLASRWCFVEFTQARALGKPVFPVIVTPFDGMLIASELQAIDLSDWDRGGRERLSRSLMSITGQIARGFRWDRSRPPFPGINAFEPEDAPIFFGRDDETREIVAMLESRRVQGGDRFVLVLGASGSGKSSVMKGGVVPVLRREAAAWSVLPPVRPQTSPLPALARSIEAALPGGTGWREWAQALADDPRGAVARLAADLGGRGPVPKQILVPVDQAEEVLSCGRAERDAFAAVLWEMANPASELPFTLLATCRTDASDALLGLPHLQALAVSVHALKPMPLSRLPELVEGPAAVASIGVEPALVRRLAADVPDAEVLPLFAFTMREMYERFAARSRQLRLADYLALGDAGVSGIENAVRQRAEDVVRSFHPDDAEMAALRSAFIPGLVRVDVEGRAFRRAARLADLPAGAERLLRAFVDARLLASTSDEAGSQLEVAHEALFRVWPTLAAWIAGEREFLGLFQHVEAQREIWLKAAPEGEREEALLQGLSLSRVRPVFADDPGRLGPLADYVRESLARDDERREVVRRQHEAVLLSQSRMLARYAEERLREGDTGTAIQLALAALPSEESPRPLLSEARVVLQAGVEAHREVARIAHAEPIQSAWFSADSRSLLSLGTNEDHVRISALDGRLVSTIPIGKGLDAPAPMGDGGMFSVLRYPKAFDDTQVASVWGERGRCLGQFDLAFKESIAFPPHAAWAVRTGGDTLTLLGMGGLERFSHRVPGLERLRDASGPDADPSSVPSLRDTCISADSRRGATRVSGARALFCWTADGSHGQLLEFPREVKGAAFAPDGRLWCVDAAGTLTILDADWSPFARNEGLCGDVRFAFFAFPPDGALCSLSISRWNEAGSAFLLDRDGVVLRRDPGSGIKFGPDGTLVRWEGETVRIEGRDGERLAVLPSRLNGRLIVDPAIRAVVVWSGRIAEVWGLDGESIAQVAHDTALSSVALSRDARLALTGGADGTVRLWDLSARRPVRVTGFAEPRLLRFLGDEPLLLVIDGEERMRVFEVGGQAVAEGHGLWADEAGFRETRHVADPSGRYLLGLAQDGGRLKDLRSGRERLLQAEGMYGVRFSPAGDRVLLWADHDADRGTPGRVHLWSTDGTKLGTIEQPRVTAATFTPEGHAAVVGGETASLWDRDLTKLARLTCETGFASEGVSDDGRFLMAGERGSGADRIDITVVDWSASTRGLFGRGSHRSDGRFVIDLNIARRTCDVFDFDGRRLAGSSRCFSPQGFRSSPDATRFILQTDRNIVALHDGADGRLIAEFRHPSRLVAMAFSPDASSIVTTDFDGWAFCWDRDGHMLARVDAGVPVSLAAVSDGGRYLALEIGEDTVEIRPAATPLDELVRQARALVPHLLTADQRLRYDL